MNSVGKILVTIQHLIPVWVFSWSFLLNILQMLQGNIENSHIRIKVYTGDSSDVVPSHNRVNCFLSILRDKICRNKEKKKYTGVVVMILPQALNMFHMEVFTVCGPAAISDQNRRAPTVHVGVGAIKLSVSLHYLLLLPFAASMERFWGPRIHHTVQHERFTVWLIMACIALWSTKRS